MNILLLALLLLLGGLSIIYMHKSVPYQTLSTILLWVGIFLVTVGLILFATPILYWLNLQLRTVLGCYYP